MAMPEDPKLSTDQPVEPDPPEGPTIDPQKAEIDDFITRHVLEKDSVFFEG
jgi:hypothetical protein